MLRIIGDAHGKPEYVELAKQSEFSVQLGDLAFDYSHLRELDYTRHVFIPGNHDNYDKLPLHALPQFGQFQLGPYSFFYVRGAFSIDMKYRRIGIDWWEQEQLSQEQLDSCVELYSRLKPDLVLTHDAPSSIGNSLFPTGILERFGWPVPFYTNTSVALEEMLNLHRPKNWFFGHFHQSLTLNQIDGTNFRCLDELETFDLSIP